jgi:hypothetical protein
MLSVEKSGTDIRTEGEPRTLSKPVGISPLGDSLFLPFPISILLSSTLGLLIYPEGRISRFLRNVGKYLADYTVSHVRRQYCLWVELDTKFRRN